MPPYNTSLPKNTDWINFWQQLAGGKAGWDTYLDFLNQNSPGGLQELEKNPSTAYSPYSAIVGMGKGKSYNDWLNNHYSNYFNLGNILKASNPLSFRWTNFFGALNPQQDYSFSSPFDRGQRPNLFSPTTRMVR